MRWMAYVLACAAMTSGLFAQSADDAIRAVVQKYLEAREQQNAQAVESIFTADADQLVSSGEWRKGRDALVKGTLASSRKSTGKRTITLTSIRRLGPAVAIADGRYELGDRKMWTCFVLVKDGADWKISAIRNMLPSAP